MLIAGIVVLILCAATALGVVVWKMVSDKSDITVSRRNTKDRKVYISNKGADAESGCLGGGTGDLFKGTSKEYLDTVIVSGEMGRAPGSHQGRCSLSLYHPDRKKTFRGNFTREIFIGRSPSAQDGGPGILLPFKSVSRSHCRIYSRGRQMYVEDLGSSFGTYVNGYRVVQATLLKSGDILEIGQERFQVELEEG